MNEFQGNVGVIYDWALFRRDVRRDVRNCVLVLLISFAVNGIATFIVYWATIWAAIWSDPNSLGMMDYVAGDEQFMFDDLSAMLPGSVLALSAIIGAVAGASVFWIWRKDRFFGDIALPATEPMTPKIFLVLAIVTQGFQFVYTLITAIIDEALPSTVSFWDSYSSAMESLNSPIGFLYIVLIGPVLEELIFRGAILDTLRRFGDNFAILFSALLFGLYHMIVLQIPFAFVMGLLLGYVAVRWSLRASIALHIFVNGMSSLVGLLESVYWGNAVAIYGMILLGCAIATLVFAIKWRVRFFARVREGVAYYPRTYANGFSSIAFWIFAAISLGIGILTMAAV